jgi:hypothetical protein
MAGGKAVVRACPTTALPQSCEGRAFGALRSLVESARKASQRSICTRIDRASGKPKLPPRREKIDNSAVDVWSAIVDANDNRFSGSQRSDAHMAAER